MALKINRQKDPVRAIGIRGFTLFFFKFAVVFCILVTFEVHPANSVPGTSNSNKDDDNNGGSLQATSSDLFDALNSAVETALSKNDNAQLIFLRENISSDCVSAAIGEIDNELEENFGSPEDASLTVNALAINLTSKTLISCPHFVNFRVLERSIEILGDAGEQSARIKLTKILDDSTFQGMTRGQAAIAIGKIVSPKPEKDQGVLTSLTTALSDDSWNVRSGACLAFEKICSPHLRIFFITTSTQLYSCHVLVRSW